MYSEILLRDCGSHLVRLTTINHMLNAIIKGKILYFCQSDESGRVKISDPGQQLDLSNLSDPLPIKNLNWEPLINLALVLRQSR